VALSAADAQTFERCIAVGGIAVFPADTVYGLACEPDSKEAVQRLYMLKRRHPDKPAAVMFFARDLALAALPELGPRTTGAVRALLPGAVTLLLPNPAGRFPLACGAEPHVLGVRVPAWPPALAALADVR
jgi:L-threonylcarbamoyladenylate synthase